MREGSDGNGSVASSPAAASHVVVEGMTPAGPLVSTGFTVPAFGVECPPRHCPPSFAAALLLVLPLTPFLVALGVGAIYMSPGAGQLLDWLRANVLLAGFGFGLLVSALIAAGYSYLLRGTAVDHANATAYTEQCQRLLEIEARLSVHGARPNLSETELSACRRVDAYRTLIRAELAAPGLRWILGLGYTAVWALLHRAEESLLLVEPSEDVLAAAYFDQLRLEDSTLPARKLLGERLAQATAALQRNPTQMDARLAVSQVRTAINQFRDTSREALVRSRNHVMGTLLATGMTALVLFSLAILGQPGAARDLISDPVVAASVVFLVGALIGLFGRLYKESAADNAVEDYGLTVARLALTPVLSGLAAVGGVTVIALLPLLINGDAITPSISHQIQPAAARDIPSLGTIYNLQANPLGIALAAVFGLTPSLLVGALQQSAESARAALKSTTAPTSATTQRK